MAELAAELQSTLDEIRRISRELRPEALDDLGLINALIALTTRAARQSDLQIERHLADDLPPLSPEQELVIYRVAQEALTNVLRHAEATHCVIELQQPGRQIDLTVSDDGRGMPSRIEGEVDWHRGHARARAARRRIIGDRARDGCRHHRQPYRSRWRRADAGSAASTHPPRRRPRAGPQRPQDVLDSQPDLAVVAEASDGDEALELGISAEIDLAVLDVSMPRLTGLQVALSCTRNVPSSAVDALGP